MNKKGQVTIFIIIALFIVIIAILAFVIIKTSKNKTDINVDKIYLFVDECIKDVGEKVIYEIGQNGGYYFSPINSTDTGITYYY